MDDADLDAMSWDAELRSRRRHAAWMWWYCLGLPFLLTTLSVYAADIAAAPDALLTWTLDTLVLSGK